MRVPNPPPPPTITGRFRNWSADLPRLSRVLRDFLVESRFRFIELSFFVVVITFLISAGWRAVERAWAPPRSAEAKLFLPGTVARHSPVAESTVNRIGAYIRGPSAIYEIAQNSRGQNAISPEMVEHCLEHRLQIEAIPRTNLVRLALDVENSLRDVAILNSTVEHIATHSSRKNPAKIAERAILSRPLNWYHRPALAFGYTLFVLALILGVSLVARRLRPRVHAIVRRFERQPT
jgi:hypothetical protein